ncbi:hypothetical protein MRB53_037070 [Persea americana]|nr:hypothetical protein MRB53_037070 [Persea americana]
MKVLFLCTISPSEVRTIWNNELISLLKEKDIPLDIISWRKQEVTKAMLGEYTHVCFLSMGKYVPYATDLRTLLEQVLVPASRSLSSTIWLNPPSMLLWNMEKTYLQELRSAGFDVPGLTVLHGPQNVRSHRQSFADALAGYTCRGEAFDRRLEDFVHEIKRGEWSLIYIDGIFAGSSLKVPAANDFRVSGPYAATFSYPEDKDAPVAGLAVGEKALAYLREKFVEDLQGTTGKVPYMRLDGIVRDDGSFAIIDEELERRKVDAASGINPVRYLLDHRRLCNFRHFYPRHSASATHLTECSGHCSTNCQYVSGLATSEYQMHHGVVLGPSQGVSYASENAQKSTIRLLGYCFGACSPRSAAKQTSSMAGEQPICGHDVLRKNDTRTARKWPDSTTYQSVSAGVLECHTGSFLLNASHEVKRRALAHKS